MRSFEASDLPNLNRVVLFNFYYLLKAVFILIENVFEVYQFMTSQSYLNKNQY